MDDSKPDDDQPAKYAIVRLRQSDNLLGLFELLIQNGFSEISFVNSLSETIFPAVKQQAGKGSSSVPANATGKPSDGQGNNALPPLIAQPTSQKSQARPSSTAPGAVSQSTVGSMPALVNGQLQLAEAQRQNVVAANKTSALSPASGQIGLLDFQQLHAAARLPSVANSVSSMPMPALAPAPSGFLGLPTLPGAASSAAAAAAAIASLSEVTTPPYSLGMFFPNNVAASTLTKMNLLAPGLVNAGQFVNGSIAPPTSSVSAAVSRSPLFGNGLSAVTNLLAPGQQQLPPLLSGAFQAQQRLQNEQRATTGMVNSAPSQTQSAKPSQKSPAIASPAGSSPGSTASCNVQKQAADVAVLPPNCATTQLRQRGQRSYADDPALYVACRLCKNKIMGSRISNLTNHVRRHSTLKQFQCCYCDYTHNEMAKVRLHMLHNHKDKESQPIDNLSPEMQAAWDLLMKECFPEHCQQHTHCAASNIVHAPQPLPVQQAQGHNAFLPATASLLLERQALMDGRAIKRSPSTCSSGTDTAGSPKINPSLVIVDLNSISSPASSMSPSDSTSLSPSSAGKVPASPSAYVRCVECSAYVSAKMKARHIRKCHLSYMLPFVCSMCGYDHAEHSKVKLHICLKHDDDPAAQVITRDLATYAEHMAPRYFPSEIQEYAALMSKRSVAPSMSPSTESACSPRSTPADHFVAGQEAHEANDVQQQLQQESVIVFRRQQFRDENGVQGGGCQIAHKKYARKVASAACGMCKSGKKFTSKAMSRRHAKRHVQATAARFTCPVCRGYTSHNKTRVKRHLLSRHGDGHSKPILLRCAKRFSYNGSLLNYVIRRCFKRKPDYRTAIMKKLLRKKLRSQSGNKRRICARRRFLHHGNSVRVEKNISKAYSKIGMRMHAVSMSDIVCRICTKMVKVENLATHLQSHLPACAPLACSFCDCTFADALTFREHILQQHPKQYYLIQQQQQRLQEARQSDAIAKACANDMFYEPAAAAADG